MTDIDKDEKMGRFDTDDGSNKKNIFTKLTSLAKNRNFLIPLALILIGSAAYFAFAATNDPYAADYVPPVPKQQLIDDVTLNHEGGQFPYTPSGWCGIKAQTYTELALPKPGCYETPGQLALDGPNTGIHEWVELSTRENSPTNLNAVVEFREVGLVAYRQGKWEPIAISKNKDLGSTLFAIVNDYNGTYNVPGTDIGYNWSPTTGNRIVGFGLGNGQYKVGDSYPSAIPGVGNERIKAHRTIGNNDWQAGQAFCQRVSCTSGTDIKAIQGWITARVVTREGKTYQDLINAGNTTGAQQLKDANYVLMMGWDRARNSGGQPGTMGRAHRVLPEWQTMTVTTMSQSQINGGLSAPPIPGYGATPTTTPTPTPTTTPTPTPTTTPTPTPTPATTALTNGTYNDDKAVFSTGWSTGTGGVTYNADEHYSNVAGSTATIKFNGEQLSLVSHNNTDMGQATITIDGVKQPTTAEWYSSSYVQTSTNWTSTKLSKTDHTAVVTLSSTKNPASAGNYISIDKIIVANAPAVVSAPVVNGLTAQYFNNTTFTAPAALSRTDANIDQLWPVDGSPGSPLGSDNFSARWTGKLYVPVTGSYQFSTWSDDGVAVWVNGTQVINNLTYHAPTVNTSNTSLTLVAGTAYDIRADYFEGSGGSTMQLKWTGPSGSGISNQSIPASAFKSPTAPVTAGLSAQYYNNLTLTDPVAVSRIETQPINYLWYANAPAVGVNVDATSTRWTGKFTVPTTGNYTFHTVSDDGVRVWVNNSLVINNWTDHGTTDNYSAAIPLNGGTKNSIKVEYYENGGWATMQLKWAGPGISDQVIPASVFSL